MSGRFSHRLISYANVRTRCARLVGDRYRAARHGRHAARPALRQLVLAGADSQPLRTSATRISEAEARSPAGPEISSRHGHDPTGTASTIGAASSDWTSPPSSAPLWNRWAICRERRNSCPSSELSGKRRVLVTNAHPVTLAIKNEQVRLSAYFDACYSTHPFDAPKEAAAFWPRLNVQEPFVPQRTLIRGRQRAGARCGARFRHRLAAGGAPA